MSNPLDNVSKHHDQMQDDLEELIASVRKRGSDGPLNELSSFLRDEIVPHATGEEKHLSEEEQQAIIDGLHDKYEDDDPELDVRSMAPPERHPVITEEVDQLEPDEALVLVNDHDPKPLYYELRSLRGDTFTWDYLQEGPQEWRVRIEKTADPDEEELDQSPNLDLQQVPDEDRKQTVFHRYQLLDKGESMELRDDSEMEELYDALRDRNGDAFSWIPLEEQDDGHRVRVRRGGADADADNWDLIVKEELDVRDLPPKQRHQQIFDRYENLDPNTAFVLVNDHDPKPLYYQFEAEKEDAFSWSYLQEGPDVWKVEIGKRGDRDE